MALVAERLGIELVEMKAAPCTGAGVAASQDPLLVDTYNALTFSMAEDLGLPILTICSTCVGSMRQAEARIKETPGRLDQVNRILEEQGKRYRGGAQITHFLWVLLQEVGLDRLQREVRRPLAGLRIAPFYGCYILRPAGVMGVDDPDHPTSLDRVIRALGGEPVEYTGKSRCCGFPILLENETASLAMTGNHLAEAADRGAHLMVTPCPLCHMNLDLQQSRAARQMGRQLNLPVLHLPQLVGLALGIPPKALGLARHLVSAKRVPTIW
jgi:succinate dehydrogenase / fumarate reductase cytochrome b subunit